MTALCTACEEFEDGEAAPACGDFRTDSGPARLCPRHRDRYALPLVGASDGPQNLPRGGYAEYDSPGGRASRPPLSWGDDRWDARLHAEPLPSVVDTVADLCGLDRRDLDWHVEAVHGWESHDAGYDAAVTAAARCLVEGGCP